MKKLKYLIIIIGLGFATDTAYGQETVAERREHLLTEDGIALQGYDAVAYFTQNKAVKGSKKYRFDYKGITYQFSSQSNLDAFKKDPAKYEPEYGGWCAYAIADRSFKMEPDPETFKIENGKLLLFYNGWFNNTKKTWNGDPTKYKGKADKNWNELVE
ncbi:MAG: YHS domain-containing (seleno)protein [Bacteroidota bacterium]